ncbi:secreted protein containing plastocyanin domain protein [Enhygromyxa salina]|uniref:Secreted protein containing plastocyanin domain protein n=1 Tax=Enhygromyxa salina TaxID=215803 RepID=A0A0C2CTH6_9BACT|nr:cupredoxin domain-containing protein [Enhygromyxa salina]KIG14466.1 secreted protein containing plastocyanin domain protein [Enhygromyxa salina]
MLRNQTITNFLALGFAAALVCLPACDKGTDKAGADKAGADKAGADKAGADKPGADKAAPATPAADDKPDAAADLVEIDGDGRIDVIVDAGGYHPSEVRAPAGSKVTLAFTRTTEQGCGQELVVEAMEIKRTLPLNEAVEIEVVVPASGEVGFACGMNMYQGKVAPKA